LSVIIIGEMDLTFTTDRGTFYCPACRKGQVYVGRKVRRFLTVYFIPLIPLHTVSELIQCQGCRGTFPQQVTQLTEAHYQEMSQREFADDVRRVMVLTMLADDHASPEEIATLRRVYWQLAGRELSDEEIERDIAMARKAGVTAAAYARAIAPRRSPQEREWIIRGAFLVASAPGDLTPERLEQLKMLPVALQVPEERFREIIEEAAQ